MATSLKNLSSFNPDEVPPAKHMKIGIAASEWNSEITDALLRATLDTLAKSRVEEKNITVLRVPGSFELISGAKILADSRKFDGIICLGCVIRGETPHFDYICQSVTQGITSLNVKYSIPFIFGVLTTNDLSQAKDRSGGKHGNKGVEAAITAIKMITLNKQLFP